MRYRPLSAVAGLALLAPPAGALGGDAGKGEEPSGEERKPGDRDDKDGTPEGALAPGVREVIVESPFEALELACVERRAAEACFQAGEAWMRGGDGQNPNATQAVGLWTAGCSFGHGGACLSAGRLYLAGRVGILLYGGDASLDFGEADRLLGLGCDLGQPAACGLRGDLNMAPQAMLPEGGATRFHGFEEDLLLARQSFEFGCPPAPAHADLRACSRLGEMYAVGQGGVRRDVTVALLYLDRACEAGAGEGEPCQQARDLRAQAPVSEGEPPRTSVQPHRPRPDTSRFEDPATGVSGTGTGSHRTRIDLEAGLGGRWTWGQQAIGGLKLRAGLDLWFNVLGVALESGFFTHRPASASDLRCLRVQHSLSIKAAFDLPVDLPYQARMQVVVGAGGTLGSLRLGSEPFVLAWGARQVVQVVLITNQQTGPRQWGAVRVEQQQTLHRGGGSTPEHSTQVVLVLGFTFGGRGPDWTPGVGR